MNFSRPMIDLVYEIRRRVPSDFKPDVKLANPELLDQLAAYLSTTKDVVTQALIKELLAISGEDWTDKIAQAASQGASKPQDEHLIGRIFRGEMLLDISHHHQDDKNTNKSAAAPAQDHHKPVRIYRGQIIED